MRYVRARIDLDYREMTYRIYVTESLKRLTRLNKGYYEFLEEYEHQKQVVTRTAEEVVDHIKQGLAKLNAH